MEKNWKLQKAAFTQHAKMAAVLSGTSLSSGILLDSAFRQPFLGAYGLNHSAVLPKSLRLSNPINNWAYCQSLSAFDKHSGLQVGASSLRVKC